MTYSRATEDELYAALLVRDARHDGAVFVAVRTTGIFCRLSCPARKPLRSNVTFYASAEACIGAGFRACKRCHPVPRQTAQLDLAPVLPR